MATPSVPQQRQTVFVTMIASSTGIMTANVWCPFTPNQMKVKQISFHRDNNTTPASQGVFRVHVRGLGNVDSNSPTVLGSVVDPCVSIPGVTIPLSTFSAGPYTFELRYNGELSGAPELATLNIILEFRTWG